MMNPEYVLPSGAIIYIDYDGEPRRIGVWPHADAGAEKIRGYEREARKKRYFDLAKDMAKHADVLERLKIKNR